MNKQGQKGFLKLGGNSNISVNNRFFCLLPEYADIHWRCDKNDEVQNKEYNHDFVVIGGGIIGAFITYELNKFYGETKTIWWFEKHFLPGRETSRVNTHVIHGGFDPRENSLNAKLSFEGRNIYCDEYFTELGIPKLKTDTFVLAFSNSEDQIVDKLYKRGISNKLSPSEIKIITGDEMRKLEPRLSKNITSALHCSSSYIINGSNVATIIWTKLREKRVVDVKFGHEVIDIKSLNKKFLIVTRNLKDGTINKFYAKWVINAAGHGASSIARILDKKTEFNIISRKGQYKIISPDSEFGSLTDKLFFTVPSKLGKGIAVAPTLDGHISLGPTAEKVDNQFELELLNLSSINDIDEQVERIFPSLRVKERCVSYIASSRSIETIRDDFLIYKVDGINFINILGIKSPGVSSAPAIGRYVLRILST